MVSGEWHEPHHFAMVKGEFDHAHLGLAHIQETSGRCSADGRCCLIDFVIQSAQRYYDRSGARKLASRCRTPVHRTSSCWTDNGKVRNPALTCRYFGRLRMLKVAP